ncbi:MAG: ester cyclase [Solirubrobacteraceae bacterium]
MSTASPTPAIRAADSFFYAYDRHDLDGMLEVCAERAQIRYVPLGDGGRGPAHVMGRAIWAEFFEAFPDLHVEVNSMFGDEANVAAEVTIGGTHERPFRGLPTKGRHYELPHAFILRLAQSRIVQITAYWDTVRFYTQLGIGARD